MSTPTPALKRFRLVPLLLCTGVSLALNLWPALSQAQTVTLSVDPLFVHYSNLSGYVTVTAKLSAAQTQETRIILRLSGTAVRGTDYTTDDSLPVITIAAEATSGTATLFIGGPPDGITERGTKTIIVRGRAPGVSVIPATITLVKDDEAQDRAALQALYRATNRAGWTANTNWNSPAALNTWHGVTTNPDGRVVTLDLSNNNLTDSIPPQVGGLAALQVLDLSHNTLSGTIPVEVGSLHNLIHLDLSANNLTGPIPDLTNLTTLIHLDLGNNALSGTIPEEVGSRYNLIHLDLSANKLSGSIPPQVGGLTELIHLDLSANKLSDSIPDDLNSLTALRVLDLSANDLTGSIPDLTSLIVLTHLDLSANKLTGRIPALDSLPELLYLNLSNNALSGSLPALPELNHLDLSDNALSGSVPDISMELPSLQFLDLSHNRFRGLLRLGSLCSALSNFTHFDLSHNQLTGSVPASLVRLEDLTHLDFSHNRFSGPLPVELGGTVNFTCIDINADGEEEEEDRQAQLDDLTWLDLSNNALSGPIPPSLGGLSNLTHLDLSHNALIRPIPPTLGELSNLQTLDLSDNTLSGSIPVSLDNSLSILQVLDLSHNTLSGTIPAEVGSLRNLSRLLLDGNTFSGPLPDEWDALSNLVTLEIDSDTGLCQTAALAEWLRRFDITLPSCGAGGSTPDTARLLRLTPAAPSTSVPGQLVSADEVHYFRLDIPRPGILIVETTGDTDTFGRLTQEGTRAVTADEDSGVDNNFRIARPVIDETYFVAVSGGGETGEYILAVEYRPGVLENPRPGSFQSGVGVISGWICEADQVVIEFERPGGTVWREPAATGTSRTDTVDAGMCAYDDSGFGLLWNWNKLGPGKHTVRALVDGVVLAEHTLIVTTLGLGEFPEGLRGDYQLEDFPNSGDTTRLLWQEAQQNFVIAAETGGGGGGHQNPGQAILGIPQPGSFQSGIGVISGWVCEAERIDIVFDPDTDNEMTFQAGYGTSRTDTSGKCGDSANGFGLLYNWNKLGPGQHTIRALADGFEFAWSTFTVTTFGREMLRRVEGEYELEDFPEVGTTVTVKWQEALQNFTITGVE